MIIIQHKIGNILSTSIHNRVIDALQLDWYETNKRILHKRTAGGKNLTLRFLKENPCLTEGDILYEDEECMVVVEILPCDAIIIRPKNMYEAASICYEIGNKHLPLFFQDEELLVPHDVPVLQLLKASGFDVMEGKRKLTDPLRSTVTPHLHENSSRSLFSKIIKLTVPNE